MSLRIRFAVAFLLLSALPLAGFALFSYSSSSQALRRAAESEADLLARDLESRVADAAGEVDRSVRALARLPIEAWGDTEGKPSPDFEAALADAQPALAFIEGFAFVPRAPATPGVAPAPAAPPVAAPGAAGIESASRAAQAWFRSEEVRTEIEKVRREIQLTLERRRQAGDVDIDPAVIDQALAAQQLALEQLDTLAGAPPSPGPEPSPAPIARVAPVPQVAPAPALAPAPRGPAPPAVRHRGATRTAERASPISGSVDCPIEAGNQVVGQIQAKIKASELLRSVLQKTDRAQGEIPFALDPADRLYVARAEDAGPLDTLPALAALRAGGAPARQAADDWVVVSRHDPATGFRYGIARPLSGAMADLKRAAARNFTLGMALVGLALVGMVPLSGRLVRNVRRLEAGAAQLAAGDLDARVPVGSRDELGRLSAAFNRMAEQLGENQRRLVEQERLRKEEEIARRLLAAENERRGRELEEAREFQLSLLPRELPRREGLDVAVSMTTATEVGGDYYDFLDDAGRALVLAVGDATGHGAAAGTMVTAVKGMFAGGAAGTAPAAFLASANSAVHRLGLVRRAMALAVARVDGTRVTLSAAGMPPVLHFVAASGAVEEIALAGTPLGARADFPYAEAERTLAPGDALLFLSDGLPELPNAEGEPFGYERLARRFGELAPGRAAAIVSGLAALVAGWSADGTPSDDVTFLVLKAT